MSFATPSDDSLRRADHAHKHHVRPTHWRTAIQSCLDTRDDSRHERDSRQLSTVTGRSLASGQMLEQGIKRHVIGGGLAKVAGRRVCPEDNCGRQISRLEGLYDGPVLAISSDENDSITADRAHC